MFLLDTNVISELRKRKPHGAVLAWLDMQDAANVFISAMTVAELQRGIEMTREQDADKAADLEGWLEQVLASGQVLALDAAICRTWAKLMHRRSDAVTEDAFIAATAMMHGLTVASRNVRDFRSLDVAVVNPFEHK